MVVLTRRLRFESFWRLFTKSFGKSAFNSSVKKKTAFCSQPSCYLLVLASRSNNIQRYICSEFKPSSNLYSAKTKTLFICQTVLYDLSCNNTCSSCFLSAFSFSFYTIKQKKKSILFNLFTKSVILALISSEYFTPH